MYPSKHYSEFSNVLTAFHGESKSLCDGTELAVKENNENSVPVGSCRRVGLRRVGLGSFVRQEKGFMENKMGTRPPTVPCSFAGTLSGDASNVSFITFTFDGL